MVENDPTVHLSGEITDRVRHMYEKYPYPHYPLFARFRWQDGYLSSSCFAAALYRERFHGGSIAFNQAAMGQPEVRMLLAGCGEMLPYIIRKNEPPSTSLVCVDLSRRSLKRARQRNLFTFAPTSYYGADLNEWLNERLAQGQPFDHIDSYGVLHHLPNPSTTIRQLAQLLTPGGTMRIMVYNRRARRFIFHLRHALTLLGLTPYSPQDLAQLRSFLTLLGHHAPALGEKFGFLGSHTLDSDARLVDTFLHPHETQIDLKQWFDACSFAGLTPLALFDRYAELDDLKNPLWQPPSWQQLEERAMDGRYENNLELFLAKAPVSKDQDPHCPAPGSRQAFGKAWQLKLRWPPSLWFSFEETRKISPQLRMGLWHHFIDHVYCTGSRKSLDSLLARLSSSAIQRLARLGAILPDQIASSQLVQLMEKPMHPTMDPPLRAAPVALQGTPVHVKVKKILASRGRESDKRVDLILQRLYAAQRGL